ncbi:MAG: HD domain-containing protein [Haloferacaceae archaeon]
MTTEIIEALPEIREIEDDDLRERVVDCFEIGLAEGPHESLSDVPWAPHYADEVGDQRLVPHVRDVVALSTALADRLAERRDVDVDRDAVLAGALVHDVSKLFEHDRDSFTDVRRYLEHPHFCVYVLETAGMSIPIQHIALAHTPNSNVEPQTVEAAIVHHADVVAMDGIFLEATGEIK